MNTLQQIENLLAPIWNKLIREKRENIPKSFVNLVTNILPKYSSYNFDTIVGKLKKIKIITNLRKVQIDLINLEVLDKKRQNDLNFLIEKFSRKFSVKEQIEAYPDIGKLERVFIKDIKGDLIDLDHRTISRSETGVTYKSVEGDFNIHIHPPQKMEILPFLHIPSIKDLINGFYVLEKNKNTKFVIVATNNENKVIGYFVYLPTYTQNSIIRRMSYDQRLELIKEEEVKIYEISKKSYKKFYAYRKRLLERLGISYISHKIPMPSYYWDENDKIFKEKPK